MLPPRFWQPGKTLKDAEKRIIQYEYERQGNCKQKTADSLGVSLRTIVNKLKAYEKEEKVIHDKRFKAVQEKFAKERKSFEDQKAASRRRVSGKVHEA